MANLFDVYNDGLLVDHTEGEKLETGETPITISGLTADTTYDKVQVAFAGSYNKSDVPSFKTKLGRNYILNSQLLNIATHDNASVSEKISYDENTNMWHITAPSGVGVASGIWFAQPINISKTFDTGQQWTFSFDIKGTGVFSNNGIGIRKSNPFNTPTGNIPSSWTRMSATGISTGSNDVVIYFNTTSSALDVYIKLPKLEAGNVATDWTPAPEDAIN